MFQILTSIIIMQKLKEIVEVSKKSSKTSWGMTFVLVSGFTPNIFRHHSKNFKSISQAVREIFVPHTNRQTDRQTDHFLQTLFWALKRFVEIRILFSSITIFFYYPLGAKRNQTAFEILLGLNKLQLIRNFDFIRPSFA